MKKNILPFLLLAMLITFANCGKDDSPTPTPTDTPGVINITLPSANAIYTNSSLLKVEGDMTDTDGLATARVEIRNKTSGAVLYQQSNSTGNVSFFRFAFNWTISGITVLTPATVKITAVDKNAKLVVKEVDIQLDN
jgi:hypothetical protein